MMHSKIQEYAPLVGRVLLALLFIISGLGVATSISGTAGYYASIGLPVAMLVVFIVLIIKIGGGLMVALGIHAREGAWALIIFTALTILIAHIGQGQLINALKNLSIIGGLLYVVAYGSGSYSLQKHCPCPMCKKGTESTTSSSTGNSFDSTESNTTLGGE